MAYTTINKSTDYFNTKLYTGNDGTNAITGLGFQPDFNWIKDRTSTGEHLLVDAVRGMYNIRSNSTAVESANGSIHQQSLDSDGFTVVGSAGNSNASGRNYASWNWKANGTGSSNTAGSINSTVSVNTTAGFSIVKWTGNGTNPSTVGHGLGVAPKMIIMKNTSSSTAGWYVYHVSNGASAYMRLNLTDAVTTSHDIFNDATPTSTVFSVNHDVINGSGNTIIAYCFAEKTGYSKFGSYTGNGNADGTFVYTGFKPAFVMIKDTASANSWEIRDTTRHTINDGTRKVLRADTSGAESDDANPVDILSNGFKPRVTGSSTNGSGTKYIYMAFAEAPLVGSNNVPCTAR